MRKKEHVWKFYQLYVIKVNLQNYSYNEERKENRIVVEEAGSGTRN